ncbi:MAG: thioether cross-link-forming SCIFF peptide maturase [Anaeromicrobium sp.]|jgi:uncharacterized protein|uniref:thioether cross-link-forming SCIFF peptide maturase n=1 Tax=Anaeromicrobium sp. TaxID=1929132 RepID=UPI0025DBC8D7|nr:thioether cross-link-forming SCIFF peptide maturase [Anaeromicrobium sp.]MCT4595015.1 thioether cross-link-forming SCIFF peptide maturase [Anaeromicrobium sp.]
MIHKFQYKDTKIVLDVNSGSVHVVDKIIYDILDWYKKNSDDEILDKLKDKYPVADLKEAIEELHILEKEGFIYSEDNYSNHPTFINRKPVVKALCLHVAHDCNIRCKYCFASQGDFKGNRLLMSEEVGMKALDLLIEKSGNRRNLEVDFFGGEPLMNFEVVKNLVEYGRKREKEFNKKFRFTITTNGLLLDDEKMEYINEHMDNVVLSIDGRKDVNDNMRYTINGNGTYDIIVPKFKKFANIRGNKNYYVRGTFTRENLNFSKDVLHLADLGFKQTSVEPVVDSEENDYAIREEDLDIIFKEYELLADEYVRRTNEGEGFNFFHFMIDLNQGPCVIKRLSGCGAGSEYLAVTPEGDIYPCHQFVGNDKFKMGDVFTKNVNAELGNVFKNAHVYNKEKCNDCWAKFYCSGGCHANAFNFNNDINVPYDMGCEMEKKRIECALGIHANLSK